MYSKRIQIAKKNLSILLLLVIGLHSLIIDGLGESLIYCFESDGSINIETKCDAAENFNVNNDKHDHFGYEYHDSADGHFDLQILDTCVKDTRTNRLEQNSALDLLAFQNKRTISYLPSSTLDQLHSYVPSDAEYQSALSLKTVVLLN